MNARCFRCGWSFSLSRELIEVAVASGGSQKVHVEYCPRCRQVIKIPMQQLRRALPPGSKPGGPAAAPEAPEAVDRGADAEPVAVPELAATEQPVQPGTASDGANAVTEEEASRATKTTTSPRTNEPAASAAAANKPARKATRKQNKS